MIGCGIRKFSKDFDTVIILMFRDLLFRNCCAEYELSVFGINDLA